MAPKGYRSAKFRLLREPAARSPTFGAEGGFERGFRAVIFTGPASMYGLIADNLRFEESDKLLGLATDFFGMRRNAKR